MDDVPLFGALVGLRRVREREHAVDADLNVAGIDSLRPHGLRHTLRNQAAQGGADVAQVHALLGHASLDTSARYFRAGAEQTAVVVEAVFEQ